MIINHNLSAINSNRVLKYQHWEVSKDMEKLSSGLRINRSGDDASGLAVSEKMRAQIQGLRQAERNSEDGLSLIQTAEGYLSSLADIIQRVRVLAVQSSNGIYSATDRQMIQVEVSQLVDEIDRVASQAEFNKMSILKGEFARGSRVGSMWFHIGPNQHQRARVYIQTMTAQSLGMKGLDGNIVSLSSAEKANDSIGTLDAALTQINKQRADLGAYYNRLEHTAKGLMNAYENTQAAESRIRDADMAETSVNFTKNQILVQSGTAMLAQANIRPQTVLQLLR
ncbi:MAG: flagellin [Leptonema sp. (in: Bacteria)]|nr:flagellin [Leptonema sp. (in: bacteria)]